MTDEMEERRRATTECTVHGLQVPDRVEVHITIAGRGRTFIGTCDGLVINHRANWGPGSSLGSLQLNMRIVETRIEPIDVRQNPADVLAHICERANIQVDRRSVDQMRHYCDQHISDAPLLHQFQEAQCAFPRLLPRLKRRAGAGVERKLKTRAINYSTEI